MPTTAVNECELAGEPSTVPASTTGAETLPATGSDSGPLGALGLIGLMAGVCFVALASRRRFSD